MILMDYSQIAIAAFFTQGVIKTPQEDLIRHVTLNTIRSYVQKFSGTYGQPVMCADGKNTWRKQFFPYYKASRVKSREESDVDWKLIFDTLTKIYQEMDSIPLYPCIRLDGAEADDVIAVLSEISFRNSEKTVIISSDHDFAQLQKYDGIVQFSPSKNVFIKEKDPSVFLLEHIIRGDTGDGIPNIFSDDDCLVDETKRQSVASKKRVDMFVDFIFNSLDDRQIQNAWKRNYDRNKTLIDFQYIPRHVSETIKDEYEHKVVHHEPNRGLFLNYLVENRCRMLIKSIEEFFPPVTARGQQSSLNFF